MANNEDKPMIGEPEPANKRPQPAWLLDAVDATSTPTLISKLASTNNLHSCPAVLGSTPRLTSVASKGSRVELFQRVSQQGELHLPSLKSARTAKLAATLNLSPRLCKKETRSAILLHNPLLLRSGVTEKHATSLHSLQHGGAIKPTPPSIPPLRVPAARPRGVQSAREWQESDDAPSAKPASTSSPRVLGEEASRVSAGIEEIQVSRIKAVPWVLLLVLAGRVLACMHGRLGAVDACGARCGCELHSAWLPDGSSVHC